MRELICAAVIAGMACCFGCGSSPEPVPDLVFQWPDLEGTFEEDLSARKPYAQPPAWIYKPDGYAGAPAGAKCFSGIGSPRATDQEARENAIENAYRQITRYMGTKVGVASESEAVASGDTRGGGYEAVTDRIFSTAVASNTVSKARVLDIYYTAGVLVQNIAKRRVYRACVLVAFGAEQAVAAADQAKVEVKKEISTLEQKKAALPAKKLEAREQVRFDSLKRLEKKLDDLNADDFKL